MDAVVNSNFLMIQKIKANNLNNFVVENSKSLSHATHFVIDLTGLNDNNDEMIASINILKRIYLDMRIIVLADSDSIKEQNRDLLRRIFEKDIFDIITELTEAELEKSILTGKTADEASGFFVARPNLQSDEKRKELEQQNIALEQQNLLEEQARLEEDRQEQERRRKLILPNKDFRKYKPYVSVALCGTEPHVGTTHNTSLIPKTITVGDNTLTLSGVNWKNAISSTIDYEALANTYTAVATYTGTGTRSNATGYTTTALYKGEISKLMQGKTIYKAYFTGTEIKPEPTIEELEQQLKDKKEQSRQEGKETSNGFTFNPLILPFIFLGIALIGGIAYMIFLRKNVTVFTMIEGNWKKIGKTRTTKKNHVVDLTAFTSKVITPSFIVVLDMFIARSLADKTVTINYGDGSFQHIITLVNEDGSRWKRKDYQIEVDF